jgi:hypothetical protein
MAQKKTLDELVAEYSDLWDMWHSAVATIEEWEKTAERYRKELSALEQEILSHIPTQIKANLKKE